MKTIFNTLFITAAAVFAFSCEKPANDNITPSEEKLAKHGVESVRQRVINIRDIEATTIDSTSALAEAVQQYWSEEQIEFSQEDLLAIDAIEQEYLDPEFINRL